MPGGVVRGIRDTAARVVSVIFGGVPKIFGTVVHSDCRSPARFEPVFALR